MRVKIIFVVCHEENVEIFGEESAAVVQDACDAFGVIGLA